MRSHEYKSSHFDLAVDTISEQDVEELIAWLREYPRLTMAGETASFEKAWSDWLGVKYSVICNSGSSANLLLYAALDSTERSGKRKVVVPATGWITTVTPAIQLGWCPLMCKSDPHTYGLNLDHLEEILKRDHPEVVIVVHVLGVPNDMTKIMELQQKYEFQILEDCCSSHGSRHKDKLVGTFGVMSSFSFYYGHHMSMVEGGVVCTNDEQLYYHLLMLRSHGWLKDLPTSEADRIMQKYGIDPFHSPFVFAVSGFNLRPTDISAKIGLIQLSRLEETIQKRVDNHRVYEKLLKDHFEFATCVPGDMVSSISFCAVAGSVKERRKVLEALDKNKVDTRMFTAGNLGRHPFWIDRYGTFSCPVADKLYEGGFFLPNNQSLNRVDIESICDVVINALT